MSSNYKVNVENIRHQMEELLNKTLCHKERKKLQNYMLLLRKAEELKYTTVIVKYFVESGQLKQDQEKFRELCIESPQNIPELHSLGRVSNIRREDKTIFNSLGLRKGKFTLQEDNLIKNYWKKFCKKYQWRESEVEPVFHLKNAYHNCKPYAQKLAKGLLNRHISTVY